MYSDKKNSAAGVDSGAAAVEDQQDKTLEWLLEMDLSEPNEKLFVISQEEQAALDLSESEAEYAARPMFRGNGQADDLSAFVDEEIVMSEANYSSDIYSRKDTLEATVAAPKTPGPTYVAIDHSRKQTQPASTKIIDDGFDILGLEDDDDIGEQPLVIKRMPRGSARTSTPALTAGAPASPVTELTPPQLPEQPVAVAQPTTDPSAPVRDSGITDAVDFTELNIPEVTSGGIGSQILSESEVDSPAAVPAEPVQEVPELRLSLDQTNEHADSLGSIEQSGDDGYLSGSPVFDVSATVGGDYIAGLDGGRGVSDHDDNSLDTDAAATTAAIVSVAEHRAEVADTEFEGASLAEMAAQFGDSDERDQSDNGWDDTVATGSDSDSSQSQQFVQIETRVSPDSLETRPADELQHTTDQPHAAQPDAAQPYAAQPDAAQPDYNQQQAANEGWLGAGIDTQLATLTASSEELEAQNSSAWQLEQLTDETGLSALEIEELTAVPTPANDLEAQETSAWQLEYDPGLNDTAENEPEMLLQVETHVADDSEALLQLISGSQETAGHGDVFGYVAANQLPADDTGFDEYLLGGKHLEPSDCDLDELVVEVSEGVDSVDPSLDTRIDYHQDFSALEGFNDASLAAVTPLIGPVMDELSVAVQQRLSALAMAPDSVEVQIMLGGDPYSAAQCCVAGYLPIAEVCDELPTPLREVRADQVALIHIRLQRIDDQADCNDLFAADFIAPGTELAPDPADGAGRVTLSLVSDTVGVGDELPENDLATAVEQLLSHEEGDVAPLSEVLLDDLAVDLDAEIAGLDMQEMSEPAVPAEPEDDFAGFDLDTMSAQLEAETDDDPFADIDFGDLGDWDEPAATAGMEADAVAEVLEDHSNQGLAELVVAADDTPGALEATTEAQPATPGENDATAIEGVADAAAVPAPDLVVAAGDAGTESEAANNVFDDDIFAEDVSDEVAGGDALIDVDALLDSLGEGEDDIGDICGVDVDEFGSDEPRDAGPDSGTQRVVDTRPATEISAGEAWCIPGHIKFSSSTQSTSDIFQDFLDAFIEEAASELEKLEDAVAAWEVESGDRNAYDRVTRILHNIKGIAKGVGLQRYGTFIHNFETLLDGLARPQNGEEAAYFQIINAWLDTAVTGFEHIQDERSDVAGVLPLQNVGPDLALAPPAEVAAETSTAGVAEATEVPELALVTSLPAATSNREQRKDKQLADEGAKVLAAQGTIRMTSEALDHLLNLSNQAQQLGVRASQSTFRSKRAAAELFTRLSSVRAHIAKIADRALLNVTARGGQTASEMDALEMDQYSELQEAANILREGVEDLDDLIHHSSRQTAAAEALLKQQTAVITSLGSSIRGARVVPLSRLMPGLRRIVRTVGADLGKAVTFKVLNEVGKLDRDSHACCQIILEHMVRNALDHGIEMPQDRLAAGKATTGLVTIDVSKQGSDYVITLADDGRGIDPELMREAAFEKGLDVDVAALSDREAIRLIFHKGFSTASRLSEISGRGVGMDIVLSELQQIGGDIEIDSVVGQGTTFKVRIPSNVTVNGALLVTAGETSYAIPLEGLIAVEHIPVKDFYEAIESGSKLPLFGMECAPTYLTTLCYGDSLPDRSGWGATVPVIVAGSEERYMAIAIDDVQQALELVIRSLGNQFSTVPGVAGGATTADGQAIVALDLNALVASVAAEALSGQSVEKSRQERMLVLVVDDSRTQRMVATSQFDTLGVETVTAENGMVAIDFLNTTHRFPDVILLDVEMPVKDGIQTLREIRKSNRYSDIPVIMVTSRTGAKHRALAQEAGCNGYMGKPFNFPLLVDQIVQLTGQQLQVS